MKNSLRLLLFTLAILTIPHWVLGQDTTKTKKDTTKVAADTANSAPAETADLSGLDLARNKILSTKDSSNTIAIMEIRKTMTIFKTIPKSDSAYFAKKRVRVSHNKKGIYYVKVGVAKISKVHVLVREGLILEIEATTDHGIFRNKYAIIDLTHLGKHGGDTLKYESQDYHYDAARLYGFLDEVIKYTPLRSYGDIPYASFDIQLNQKDSTYELKESTSLNTYFNIASYTDIKGISGSPNGLAQFHGEAKFITNTRNFKGGAVVWLNYVAFEGGLSKYDSQYKGTFQMNDTVNRRDLFQRSTYSVGAKLNLLHGYPSPYPRSFISDWQINIGYNFIGSQVGTASFKDSAKTVADTTFRTATQNDFYIEPMLSFSRHGNFGLTMALPFHWISVKESANITNSGWERWIAPSIELMYFAQKDSNSKLFFRYRYYENLGRHSQAFTQIQIGYSLNLSSVWGATGN